jgi:transposase
VAKLVVCNPRKNALLKYGNKSDRIDARKLAELLRGNHLKPVYHGENGVRTLRELARSYLTIVKDLTRVMSRLKALYRSWAIACAGRDVYYTRHRAEWLGKIHHAGVRRRAEQLYQHLDELQRLRQEVRRELLAESRKHPATAKLRHRGHDTKQAPSMVRGLDVAENIRASGAWRKMFLDIPSPKTLSSVNLRDLKSKFGGSFSE